MTYIAPGTGRSRIVLDRDKLVVTIPSQMSIFLKLFLGFWLVGWCMGEIFAISSLLSVGGAISDGLFLAVWLIGWTIGGVFEIYVLSWGLFGKEIISLGASRLSHTRYTPIYSRVREYDVAHISNLRVAPSPVFGMFNQAALLEFWGVSGGSISFDYGRSTHKFGNSLDEAEAKHVIKELQAFNRSLVGE